MNQEILNLVKKNITLEKAKAAVDLCNAAGIEPMTSYILGLPGETPETVRKTMEFARNLSPMYGYHILAPFPGTEVREKAAEYGMRILTDDWDLYDANRSVAESIHMSHEEIDRIVNEFNGGIRRYVEALGERKKLGEVISNEDQDMLGGILSFDFSEKVISGQVLERYPGLPNGARINRDGDSPRSSKRRSATVSPTSSARFAPEGRRVHRDRPHRFRIQDRLG